MRLLRISTHYSSYLTQFQAMRRIPLEPLDVNLLREVIKP